MPRVLVVDDEPSLLRLTAFSLQAAGFEVVTAETAAEARKQVVHARPDLVILDVMLPDGSGLDVCRGLRSDPATADLPIILLSARAQEPDRERGLRSGASDYVTKPVDADELAARVERLLERAAREPKRATARGLVHAFVGAKGGVGTTTVAQAVARTIASGSAGAAALELKSSLDTWTSALELGPGDADPSLPSWSELSLSELTPFAIENRLLTHASTLRILPGLRGLDAYRDADPESTRAVVEILASLFEHTVVDVACHPSPASRAALGAADDISIVLERDPSCLLAGKATAELLRKWGAPSGRLGLVIVDRTGIASTASRDVGAEIGCAVRAVLPRSPLPRAEQVRVAVDAEASSGTEADADFSAGVTELARKLSRPPGRAATEEA